LDVFDELNKMIPSTSQHDDAEEINTPEWKASAELGLFKSEQPLPMMNEADKSYNNPLDWWRVKASQYPLLAQLAVRLLEIPATSAPSE
jgi:hypothetical protein